MAAQVPAAPVRNRSRWTWPTALLVIAAIAGVADAWDITMDGIEVYYAAGVRSMAVSWHLFLYGGFDPHGLISLDKLPGPFWAQALSVRAFGLSVWAMVAPTAGCSRIAPDRSTCRSTREGHSPSAPPSLIVARSEHPGYGGTIYPMMSAARWRQLQATGQTASRLTPPGKWFAVYGPAASAYVLGGVRQVLPSAASPARCLFPR